jgi:cysteine-rich repeat protein
VSGDGCDASCHVEDGFACNGGSMTATSICAQIVCGDGIRLGAEVCDDGNALDGDGCDSSCQTEAGFECTGGSHLAADTCSPKCGDGVNLGDEACDDGNLDTEDGCNNECEVEIGWQCSDAASSSSSQKALLGESSSFFDPTYEVKKNVLGDTTTSTVSSVCTPTCGDARRVGEETCDDANDMSGDGCSSECKIEQGWVCSPSAGAQDNCERKVDCQESQWGSYTACTKTCGGGTEVRTRFVDVPASNGGAACGNLEESRNCNTQGCPPVDCQVGLWAEWGTCDENCGGGKKQRFRVVSSPAEFGGAECADLEEEEECNTEPCTPQACVVALWGDYSECTQTCGGGQKTRNRVVAQAAEPGGEGCPELSETIECNTTPCPDPVDCAESAWSAWSECDATCGGGSRTRSRTVETQPVGSGQACGVLSQTEDCNPQACPQA